jgi:hypothetical protein
VFIAAVIPAHRRYEYCLIVYSDSDSSSLSAAFRGRAGSNWSYSESYDDISMLSVVLPGDRISLVGTAFTRIGYG